MMKDEKINWNDPLFLVSRGLDGDLSPLEQGRLDEALAASAELRVEAENIRTVARLVEGRRAVHVQIDWKTHEKLVLAEVSEAENLAGIDERLLAWGQRVPQYDERALASGVMARIAPAQKHKQSSWRVVARLGAPLAAAAAVVLAVTATWFAPVAQISMTPVTVVQIGPLPSADSEASVAIVSFAKPAANPDPANGSLTFGYMTLGSSPTGLTEESPL